METFSFNPPKFCSEERKWLLAVNSSGATNSGFNITEENNSFSVSTPEFWSYRGVAKSIRKLQNLLRLRAQIDFDLHIQDFRKRGNQLKIGENEHNLSDLDTGKKTRQLKNQKTLNITILKIWFLEWN